MSSSLPFVAGVAQIGADPFDPLASAAKVAATIRRAAGDGVALLVFPEACIGGYPKGASFSTPVGMRLPEGREAFRRYHEAAIDLHGPELALVAEAAAETGMVVVLGVIEREGGTLYCTALTFDGARGLAGRHRKLMPTAAERLIWGFGDGSTMEAVQTRLGTVGAVICWENYMPALRMHMYAQGVTLYCAPTADDRDSWLSSMRHIALEGRCFVLTACQFIRRGAYPADYDCALGNDPETVLMRGGSAIVGPLGQVLAGPDFDGEAVLTAQIDPAEILRGKYDFDATGHYARPDIFRLEVDTAAKPAVLRRDGGL